jgi:hypothetical protein
LKLIQWEFITKCYILHKRILLEHMLSYAVLFLYMHTYTHYIEACVTGIYRKVVFLMMSVLPYSYNVKLVRRIHKLYILDVQSNV